MRHLKKPPHISSADEKGPFENEEANRDNGSVVGGPALDLPEDRVLERSNFIEEETAALSEGASSSHRTAFVASIDEDDPEQMAVLQSHVVEGLTPESTTVNLFDYDTGRRSGDVVPGVGTIGAPSTFGTDTLGTTGTASAWRNYKVWLDDPASINYGRLLTFGDGMRHLGYWNQGLVQSYQAFGEAHPGMQNIVSPLLVDGFPALSDEVNPSSFPSWLRTGDYDAHTALYADATRIVDGRAEYIYANAGEKNISNGAQYLAVNPGDVASAPANTASGGGQDLTENQRSLSYLFDPEEEAVGRVRTCTDVDGLFQIDDEGYYYYNMRDNYACYDEETNAFVLYDEPAGLRTDAPSGADERQRIGNFFPFNPATQAFSIENGQLVNAMSADNDMDHNSSAVDHHLGLTLETSFRQPVGGKAAGGPMTFEFIGDDDMWVFIDDVLVLDLGGIHSELFGTIDFSSGEVRLGTAFGNGGRIEDVNTRIRTTIKDMFEAAGIDTDHGFTGHTFASNTSHTLKMFYLERGNYDSSLAMRFNLQPELYQQIKKVDQDGFPVKGASFDMFAVSSTRAPSAQGATLDDIEMDESAPLCSVTTDEDGMARFMDGDDPFNFADRVTDDIASQLFVLREKVAPAGYRLMPVDMLLRYDRESGTFIVNDRYESGAYASFNSYVNQISSASLLYGAYDANTGRIEATSSHVPASQQARGLVVAVPTIRQNNGKTPRWEPLYGSNNGGFDTVLYDSADASAMRDAILQAALCQAYLSSVDPTIEGWYLLRGPDGRLCSYRSVAAPSGDQLACTLSDLPGNPTRYVLNDPEGDMQMVYGIVSGEVFGNAGANLTEKEKYAYLSALMASELAGIVDPTPSELKRAAGSVAADIARASTSGADVPFSNRGFSAIDTSAPGQFERSFRTVMNVPNEQRELRVWKMDQYGERMNGAVFALFENEADALAASDASVSAAGSVTEVRDGSGRVLDVVAAGVTGELSGDDARYRGDDLDGMLVFAPYVGDEPGGAHTVWMQDRGDGNGRVLYLKEVQAPSGYEVNSTVVAVVVGRYGVYADAGDEMDGVDVLAGVGKLASTMTKYAASPHLNLTLRYILSTLQNQRSDEVRSLFEVDANGATSLPFDRFDEGWRSDESARMHLTYAENALIDYGSADGFTEEEIASGVGYIDAKGRMRPLFRTESGFIRTSVEQDSAAMRTAQASGEYAGVAGDDLEGQGLTSLFAIRNTVRMIDTKIEEEVPPDEQPDEGPNDMREILEGDDSVREASLQDGRRSSEGGLAGTGDEMMATFLTLIALVSGTTGCLLLRWASRYASALVRIRARHG